MHENKTYTIDMTKDYDSRLRALTVRKALAGRKRRKCPICYGLNIAPIEYGYPDGELIKKSTEGKVILGGCVIYEGMPTWGCTECGYRWRPGEDVEREKLCELKIVSVYKWQGADKGTESYIIYTDGTMLVREYVMGETEVPYMVSFDHLLSNAYDEIEAILEKYRDQFDEMPEELSNGSLDGAFWYFTFGGKTVQSLNPARIRPEFDYSKVDKNIMQVLRYEDVLVRACEEISGVLKNDKQVE